MVTGRTRDVVIFLNKLILFLARRWELLANGLFALVLGLAILAPALMAAGLTEAGQAIYRFFAPHDHQLPQRSYFLFSQVGGIQTYSLEQILTWGALSFYPRAFVGNPEIGFKMAINHRMTAIFVGLLGGGLLWSSTYVQPKVRWFGLTLLTFPMMLDALSHMATERMGFPFREGNLWAVWLTGGAFPTNFYTGTTMGSLDWLLRTVTGLLFGLGTVWYLYPYLHRNFANIRKELEPKLRKIGAIR
jgi:uncharacterized membrane protein